MDPKPRRKRRPKKNPDQVVLKPNQHDVQLYAIESEEEARHYAIKVHGGTGEETN